MRRSRDIPAVAVSPSRFEDLFVAWLRGGPRAVISHAEVFLIGAVSLSQARGLAHLGKGPSYAIGEQRVTLRTSGGCVEACLTDRVRVLWDLS